MRSDSSRNVARRLDELTRNSRISNAARLYAMISTWSEWKRYPRPGRGENIEAPITPGIFEVRYAGTGALHSFEAVDNVAQALAQLSVGSKSWFGRRDSAKLPDLEGRRQGCSPTHDRPPRNLYERRGLIGPVTPDSMLRIAPE